MKTETVGIILAAGKGTRMQSDTTNKTVLIFNGKPMIHYGLEVMESVCQQIMVVVGFAKNHVISVIKRSHPEALIAVQKTANGTAGAVKVAVEELEKQSINPQQIIVGYGDHMMFYRRNTLEGLLKKHISSNATITMLVTQHEKPNQLKWGRVLHDGQGNVSAIIENIDASSEQKKVKTVNPGLYCIDYSFIIEALDQIEPSPVSGEYYLADIVTIAKQRNRIISSIMVPFEEVGIGVNTPEQLERSTKLHKNTKQTTN